MQHKTRMLIAALAASAMLAAPFADAARLGGGNSRGMTRSYTPRPAPSRVQPTPSAPISQPQPQAAPQRSGPGWGGVAAGAAAGAAAGYMLGHATSGGNQATQMAPAGGGAMMGSAQQPVSSGFPWGTLLLLGGLTAIGFMLFRRMTARPAAAPSYGGAGMGAASAPSSGKVYRIGGDAAPAASFADAPAANVGSRLPDGTETVAFLRQAKASFMHLQTMNSPDSVDELRKYLTPDMFEAIRADVQGNTETAEFPELNAEVIEAAREGSQYIATVRFHGRVSESLNSPEQPFTELWHFTKPADGAALKWLVAGIQQI
ncbi:Tim44-like domain-containing protein [Chitinivorax sp. PXF-14]|uniref:Tim44 domain-containing protein n=1 Tax=Chitinivorax sp. PXF-14 TaxID=3230488 RepID=UPI003465F173